MIRSAPPGLGLPIRRTRIRPRLLRRAGVELHGRPMSSSSSPGNSDRARAKHRKQRSLPGRDSSEDEGLYDNGHHSSHCQLTTACAAAFTAAAIIGLLLTWKSDGFWRLLTWSSIASR